MTMELVGGAASYWGSATARWLPRYHKTLPELLPGQSRDPHPHGQERRPAEVEAPVGAGSSAGPTENDGQELGNDLTWRCFNK